MLHCASSYILSLQAAVNRTAMYDIPHDAQWGDIDVMERELDFTISSNRLLSPYSYIDTGDVRLVVILAGLEVFQSM